MIRFKKLGEGAVMPCFKTSGCAGADFCLPLLREELLLQPGVPVLVGLQIALDVDEFEQEHFGARSLSPYLSVVPRSSLRKRGISFLGEGIIDIDYRGEIHALLFNHAKTHITLQPGEAIGQFILCVSHSGLLQVERRTAERGAGGFGSTGRGNE